MAGYPTNRISRKRTEPDRARPGPSPEYKRDSQSDSNRLAPTSGWHRRWHRGIGLAMPAKLAKGTRRPIRRHPGKRISPRLLHTLLPHSVVYQAEDLANGLRPRPSGDKTLVCTRLTLPDNRSTGDAPPQRPARLSLLRGRTTWFPSTASSASCRGEGRMGRPRQLPINQQTLYRAEQSRRTT